MGYSAVLFLSLLAALPARADYRLCDNVLFKEGRLPLNSNEKVLVCGSPKGSAAWKDVPLSQVEYQLGVFLQNDGYLNPRFERKASEVWVWTGPRLKIERLTLEGQAPGLDLTRLRRVVGYPLTSDRLDEITAWATTELKSVGFPCPKVEVKAQAWNGTVVVQVESGAVARIRKLEWKGSGELDPRIITRYAAFSIGDVYDIRETQLTTNRMYADGLFEMILMQPTCDGSAVDLTLKSSVGAPRLLKFGFGGSTEEWPFVDLTYRNSRLDRRASSFYTVAHASPLNQSVNVGSELYPFSWQPALFWGPRFRVSRESEREFEVNSARLGVDVGRYLDFLSSRFYGRGGPTFNYVDTVRGVGPDKTAYLNWEASLDAATHAYELNVRDQYVGTTARFEYHGQRDRIGSEINVDRYDVNFKHLWNILGTSPPLFVAAFRLSGVAVSASPIDLSERRGLLPTDYRIFWGGDRNLRGFSRQQLNNRGLGYLTGLYGGLELRLIEVLPYRLEPFLLSDIAALGERRWTLDEELFSSWGGGLRWASPVGTLRVSAAKGEIANRSPSSVEYTREWVYFFSFGQEF